MRKQTPDQRSDAKINGDSSMRIFLAGAMIGLLASAAQACEGQKGKVLYEDTFADDSGGWPSDRGLALKASGAEISAFQPGKHGTVLNGTFFFNQADYCAEVVFPPNDPNATQYEASVAFLSNADVTEHYEVSLSNTGEITLRRGSGTKRVLIWSVDQKSIANLTAGASNAIEAIVKGSTISVLLKGKLVKTTRAQIPSGDFSFGFGELVERDAPFGVLTIKSIKVTEAQ
jgi:hypothetical protein